MEALSERSSGCSELDLVQVEFEVMLRETIQQMQHSAVMILSSPGTQPDQ